MNELLESGYSFASAKVKHKVYWYNQEKEMELMEALREEFGDYCYVVQLSTDEQVLVYMDYSADLAYYRVSYSKGEDGKIAFNEKVVVKPRFLTEEEISATFVEAPVIQEPVIEQKEGTIQEENSSKKEGEFNEPVQEESKTTEESQEESKQAALNHSERQELEAFRKEEKIKLIEDFKDDLSKDFVDEIEVNKYSKDELEVILSKEFTRVTRENRTPKPTQNTFLYRDTNDNRPESESEMAARLVNRYKTN